MTKCETCGYESKLPDGRCYWCFKRTQDIKSAALILLADEGFVTDMAILNYTDNNKMKSRIKSAAGVSE